MVLAWFSRDSWERDSFSLGSSRGLQDKEERKCLFFPPNYQKELARSQRKLQLCLGAYSQQLLQLVCKPYENNIRPVTPDSQGNIQPRKSIPTDLEIIAANLSVKEQQQKIQN